MLGRVLFTVVWLIISAGLLLPVYVPDGAGPGPAPTDTALSVVGALPTDCRDCAAADRSGEVCQPDCPCGQVLPTAVEAPEDASSAIVYLVVRPQPPGLSSGPQPLPPKLPAI